MRGYEADEIKEILDDNLEKMSGGVESYMPTPVGWSVLVAVIERENRTEGGVLLPEQHLERENLASLQGLVISMGDSCYKDETKFSAPWCKEGDIVMFRSYTGTRFKVKGQQFRLIPDDSVEAVIPDPRQIERF